MRPAVSRASVAMDFSSLFSCHCIASHPKDMNAVAPWTRLRSARRARRTSLYWVRSKRHATCPACGLCTGLDIEITGPALRLVTSVLAVLWVEVLGAGGSLAGRAPELVGGTW